MQNSGLLLLLLITSTFAACSAQTSKQGNDAKQEKKKQISDGDTLVLSRIEKEGPPAPPVPLPPIFKPFVRKDSVWLSDIENEKQRIEKASLAENFYFFRCNDTSAVGKFSYFIEGDTVRKIVIQWPKQGKWAHVSEYWYPKYRHGLIREIYSNASGETHEVLKYVKDDLVFRVQKDGNTLDCTDCSDFLDRFPYTASMDHDYKWIVRDLCEYKTGSPKW